MARGPRLPVIAKGIYPDRYGFEVRQPVKGKVYKTRFGHGTPLAVMQQWQADEKAWRLKDHIDNDHAKDAPIEHGTWKTDVALYLKTREGRAGYKSDKSHLGAWVKRYGARLRAAFRQNDAKLAVAVWLSAGLSPKTIRHRIRVGKEMWHHFHGSRSRTPFDDLGLPALPDPNPVPVPSSTITAVAASLKRGLVIQKACGPKRTTVAVHTVASTKTLARFKVRAVCGVRPCQVMWAEKDDVDLTRRIWFVRSSKGGTQIPLPLNAEGVKAWKAFIAADAWGDFDTRSFSKTVKRHGWPENVRPYQLRHTFAIDHLLSGTSLGDLQGLMGHKDITTTRKNYAPIQTALLKKAVSRRKLKL